MAKTLEGAAQSEAAPEISVDALRETAERLYVELLRGELRGRDPKLAAKVAYARARDFVFVTEAIRGGEPIESAADMQAPPPLFCRVHLWDGSKGQHGEPMKDANGKAVYEVQPVDRDAFAPNLPDDHPINQRFYPNARRSKTLCTVDGKELAELN